MKKKAQAFETINSGMIAFVSFVLIILLTILLITTTKQTAIVCGSDDQPTRILNGVCQACPTNDWIFNTTKNYCCNATTGLTHCLGANQTAVVEFEGDAYVATKDMQEAALLPPQFAQIIVIVLIIIGILSMLAMIGYGTYQRMKR